tara:strand:- start:6983 stop:8026 length:1044 start_codon:yes stop_codon:yes gene_type:complete
LAPLLWGIVLLGVTLYFAYILQVGWGFYWSEVFLGRSLTQKYALTESSGYLYLGLLFANGALALIFMQAISQRSPTLAFASAGLIMLFLVPQFAAGNRSNFIPIVVALLVMLIRVFPRLITPFRAAVFIPVFIFLGFIAPRIWRNDLSQGLSFMDSILSALDPVNLFDNFVGGLDMAMIDAFSLQVGAQASGQIPLHYGSTYVAALSAPIPRSLWPEKPVSVDNILNEAIFPSTHQLHIGFSFGIYSEPYLNFGIIGVILVMAVFGAVLGRVSIALLTTTSTTVVFLVAMLTGFMFALVRGSISYDLQRFLILVLPVLTALWIEQTVASRRTPRSTGSRLSEQPRLK